MDTATNDTPRWLKVAAAAKESGIPTRSLYRHILEGTLPCRSEGKNKLVEVTSVLRLAESRQTAPKSADAAPTGAPAQAVSKAPAAGAAQAAGLDGELSARLFERFDAGESPADVVQAERLNPPVVLAAWRNYEALKSVGGAGHRTVASRLDELEGVVRGISGQIMELELVAMTARDVAANLTEALQVHERNHITPSSRLHFQCANCTSVGFVGTKVTCTVCQQETSLGFNPP